MVPRRAIFVAARHAALRCRLPARLTWMIASELYRAGFPAPADVLSAALDSGVAISIILIFFWCVSSFSLSVLIFPPYSSSLFCSIQPPTLTLLQSNVLHLTPSSPISHRSSHLICYFRYLYFPRSVLVSFPYGRTHMLISSFSLSSPPLPYGLPLAPMCWYGPVVDGRFVCSHGLFLCACRAVYFDTAAPDSDADVTCATLQSQWAAPTYAKSGELMVGSLE